MKERVPFLEFSKHWTEHISSSTSERMKNDQVEQDFWKRFIVKKTYNPEKSAKQVMEYLSPLMQEYQIKSVIEMGPGWGSYTLPMAQLCQEVDCVDISQDVLDFIIHEAQGRGIHNIHTFHSKWEDFIPSKKYDMAFGYNCFYRQVDLKDCFARMNQAARKLCVVGMNTGIAPAWVHELDAAGGKVNWEWKDYIYFVGVLYEMGIDANVKILPFVKDVFYPDINSMVKGECARCSEDISPEVAKEILCKHFIPTNDGGWYAREYYRSGIVWWLPNRN